MKGLQITVVLLVLCISTVELLICNTCVFENGRCDGPPEKCEDASDVCVTVTCTFPRFTKSKSCMNSAQFQALSHTKHCTATQCTGDQCNSD